MFDTIAAESQRQMNETYSAWIRGRLPRYEKPNDEPTTGLHASDIEKVVKILESIVDRGNTVIVIEHNIDIIKLADYMIDIGPDGGTKGGQVVFTGIPKEMIENSSTITVQYLRKTK